MVGRPKLQGLIARIAREGGDDVILDRIAAGERIGHIAKDYNVDRRMLYFWRDAGGQERKDAWSAALEASGDALVEEGQEIIDTADASTPAQVTLANSRANWRKWLAGIRNKQYADNQNQGVNVHLNIGELHLDALRKASHTALPTTEQPKLLEAEIIEEDEDS